MDAGLIVSLLGIALTVLLFLLGRLSTRGDRAILIKVYNRVAHGADYVKALAGKIALRGTVSARLIRKDGTIVDLGELKPPR